MAAPKTTRIAGDTTQAIPQSTAAGDAPADTYDPLERVSSVNPDKAAAAAADYLTVNAVEPVASIPATMTGVIALGRGWWKSTRAGRAPAVTAASTKSSPFRAMTCARVRRVNCAR